MRVSAPLRIFWLALGFIAASPSFGAKLCDAPATLVLPAVVPAKLDPLSAHVPAKRFLFIDLDNTMGHLGADGQWTLYDGVRESLDLLRERYHLVLLTANSAERAEQFIQSGKLHFDAILASEDYAPHFKALLAGFLEKAKTGEVQDPHPSAYIYKLWREDPTSVLPPGVIPHFDPTEGFAAWLEKIYEPWVQPKKWTIVRAYGGILVDDTLWDGNDRISPELVRLIDDGMGVFVGPRGGPTRTSGPNWPEIARRLSELPH